MPVVAVSKVLRERLTDEGVEEFIEILSEVEEEARKDSLVIAEERFERRITEEISSLRTELKVEMASLRTELKVEMASLRTELKVEMASFKAEIIKWMFLFWIGQLVIIAGMIKWLR